MSFEVCRLVFGPEFPDKAFYDLHTLRDWYHAVLHAWLSDPLAVAEMWRDGLPSQENALALCQLVLEAKSNGVRRIQRRMLQDCNGVPWNLPIDSYSELSLWCDLMFELLSEDDLYVSHPRQELTIRYDKGVAYRLQEKRKEFLAQKDGWLTEFTYSFLKALSKGEPRTLEPDDDWLLVVWGDLARQKSALEAALPLFIDAEEQPKHHTPTCLITSFPLLGGRCESLGPCAPA